MLLRGTLRPETLGMLAQPFALPKIGLLPSIAIRNRMMAIGKMGAQPNTSVMTYISNHCYRRLVIFIRETKMRSSD